MGVKFIFQPVFNMDLMCAVAMAITKLVQGFYDFVFSKKEISHLSFAKGKCTKLLTNGMKKTWLLIPSNLIQIRVKLRSFL